VRRCLLCPNLDMPLLEYTVGFVIGSAFGAFNGKELHPLATGAVQQAKAVTGKVGFGGIPGHFRILTSRPARGQLLAVKCGIKRAANLPKADIIGSSDPYVVIELRRQTEGPKASPAFKYRTKKIMNDLNPEWNERFSTSPFEYEEDHKILVTLYDYDFMKSHDKLGYCEIPLTDLINKTGPASYKVLPCPDGVKHQSAGAEIILDFEVVAE